MEFTISTPFTHLLDSLLENPKLKRDNILVHTIADLLIQNPQYWCDYLVSYFIKKYEPFLMSYNTCDWPYRKFILLMKSVFLSYKKKNTNTIMTLFSIMPSLSENHRLPKEMIQHISSCMISTNDCLKIFTKSFLKCDYILRNINFCCCLQSLTNIITGTDHYGEKIDKRKIS